MARLETLVSSLTVQSALLQRLNVFSENELKAIANHRKFYERTFSRDDITCEDMLLCVRYELDLLAVIREKKVDDSHIRKKNEIMYSSANLLNKLFLVLTGNYPEKLQLWLLYVKFCRQMKDNITLLSVIENLLKVHRDKPLVFQLAARVAREDLRNLRKARDYLVSGIRVHIDSEELYREAFVTELSVSRQKFESAGKENPDDAVYGKTLNLVYDAARMKIHSVDFYIDLLNSVKGLPFAKDLESRIHDDLRKRFPNKEVMWDTLASVKHDQMKIPANMPRIRDIMGELIGIYTTAVKHHLNTPLMWKLYVDRLVLINDSSKPTEVYYNFKRNRLIGALNGAHSKRFLSDKHYLMWAELQKDEQKKLEALKIAAGTLPTSVALWSKIISISLEENNEAEAWESFEDALTHFTADKKASLPLWKFMARYFQVYRPDKLVWFFDQAVSESSGVGVEMKPVYLEWVTLSRGISAGRELYDKIAPTRPHSMALHEKMIELENFQVELNARSLRRCHSLAAEQFGSHDTNVWLRWIKFENSLGKSTKMMNIKDEAMRVLQPALIDEFSSELRLFEIDYLSFWKPQALANGLQKVIRQAATSKRGNSTPARCNGRSKRICI